MDAELTLAIRRILSEPKMLNISYSTDVPAAKGYASAKISTELVDSATSRIVKAIDSHVQQEIAKAREQTIEDVKYAGYGYDDGTGFVLKISYKELTELSQTLKDK